MCFRFGKGFVFTTIYFLSTFNYAQELNLQPVSFIAQPASCVTLHQGRTCFASVTLQWQVLTMNNVCIYQKQPKKLIKCWKDSKGNSATIEFESSTKTEFQLVNNINNTVIAETLIDVSWVHKASPRKRRWRLF